MTDKKKWLLLLMLLFLAWLLFRKKSPVVEQSPQSMETSDPLLLAYANDPAQYLPAHYTYNVDGSNANVNIGPQGFGYLDNRYIPLFGFVGMAQGETWL